jgi:asparagine synthase (glutamine-hydrolysing)
MGDAIAHRGPDAEGFLAEPGVGLVHRRLSIIDLSVGANQPLGNEDGSIQVVFNGEIYNFPELRDHLEKRGHHFRTHSDTEILVHLYEEEGDRLVERLRGMFTFALWDRPHRRLLLARDRLGIKPLYYLHDGEKLVFGSEIKAILAHPGVGRGLDLAALEDYLAYGMVPGPRSIFSAIRKLPPAHTLAVTIADWNASPRRYWQLHFEPDPKPTAEEWQEAVRAKVAEAVRIHLIADVPVGAFLSGGVDSSVVVSCAAGGTKGALQTFSMGFADAAWSELPHARAVAGRYGTRHSEEVVSPDAVALLDQLSLYYDEPFADSSALPTFLVSRLAKRGVKVALSGDGGDEAFGGYSRYAHDLNEAAIRKNLPRWFRRGLLGPLAGAWPKADWLPRSFRAKTLLTNLSLDAGAAYANSVTTCRQPLRNRLLSRDLTASRNGHDPWDAIIDAHLTAPRGDALAGMLAADTAILLPDDFLVKVDRASMAHGLEVRPPLLDHELLELTARIPSHLKIRGGQTKWLFKESFRAELTTDVTHRPKQGFDIPVDDWLRGPLRPMFESAVLGSSSAVSGLIDRETAKSLYRSHLVGSGRHGAILWSLLVLARWAERYSPAP